MKTKRHIIAKNIATLLHDGDFVNLGIGIPTLIGNYLPEGVTILLHGENGYVGQEKELSDLSMYETRERLYDWWECHGGERTDYSHPEGHRDLVNAGGFFINLIPGACCFDSAMAFSMVRGGIWTLRFWADFRWIVTGIWPTGWFPGRRSAVWAEPWILRRARPGSL